MQAELEVEKHGGKDHVMQRRKSRGELSQGRERRESTVFGFRRKGEMNRKWDTES